MRKRVGGRVREEEMTKEEALRLWEQARPVEVERRRRESSVLSVRLPSHVFDELVREARWQGKGPATLARELIEEGLAQREQASLPLLLERLAERLRSLEAQSRVRFAETPPGVVVQRAESTTWVGGWARRPSRPGAFVRQPTENPAHAHTSIAGRSVQ